MRRLEGQHLRLYYPDGRQDEARRFLYRVEACARYLRGVQHVHNSIADAKMTVILPEDPLNNAFVAPRFLGYQTKAVVPTFATGDMFSLEFGLPPDPGIVGCHEITHYVHAEQIAGFPWLMNSMFGTVYTPQMGLDSWFAEGLAVYYETKLIPGVGRLAWPLWRGAFAAGFAGRRINGGDLHVLQRKFHAGHAYLVGSQFVRFLADRYGEEKLWKLIHKQARSVLFPFGVNVRFWQAYDKSLSTLIDEFADEVAALMPARARPAGQRVVRDAGNNARYARAGDGSEALITAGLDTPARLTIYGPNGALRMSRNLTDVAPPRDLAVADPMLVSGLSFTADARSLYFVAIDVGPVKQVARLLRYEIASDQLTVVVRDLGGAGGGISPDGGRYAYARADGDHHDLAELDVRSGTWRIVAVQPPGGFVSQPRYSPDGRRIVASDFDGKRFGIVIFDAATGGRVATIRTGEQIVHDPSWLDDRRLLYLGAQPSDAGFQVYSYDLPSGQAQRLTEAPYLAFQPRSDGRGGVRFLNREGWGWTVDEVAVPAAPAPRPLNVAEEGGAAMAVAQPAESTLAPAAPEAASAGPAAVAAYAPAGIVSPNAAAVTAKAEDESASSLDGLFVPRLHGLMVQTIGRRDLSFGLVLSGNDQMEKHRWAIAGAYQVAGGGAPSVMVAYTNRTLAPVNITATAAEFRIHDVVPEPDGSPPPAGAPLALFRRDRQASLDIWRSFWGNPVAVGFAMMETYRPGDPLVAQDRARFGGPRLSLSFFGAEATPYGGTRRSFSADAAIGIYPASLSTVGFSFTDLRGQVSAALPLPLLARHRLVLRVRARGLVGSNQDDGLLLVGGYSAVPLARRADQPETTAYAPAALPPGVTFVEALAGFEDHPFATDRIVIASAGYNYPFIIDWGTASTLGVLPAFFVRQLDLGLFGTVATDGRSDGRHAAAGGSLALSWALWEVGVSVRYQLARRLTDDHALVHLLTLGL